MGPTTMQVNNGFSFFVWLIYKESITFSNPERFFGIPMNILPEIKSSAAQFGTIKNGSLNGVPITAVLGDQQAALVGQCCFERGSAKNT